MLIQLFRLFLSLRILNLTCVKESVSYLKQITGCLFCSAGFKPSMPQTTVRTSFEGILSLVYGLAGGPKPLHIDIRFDAMEL